MFLYDMVIFRFVCLQNDAELNTGKMLSFAPGSRQQNTNFEDLQISQKEFSGLHHLNLSSLVPWQLASFNATGVTHNPKQVSVLLVSVYCYLYFW
jgi:hypothetical protein